MPSYKERFNLMPPESVPEWDRFQDRKRGYNLSSGGGGGGGSRGSDEFSPRIRSSSFQFRRPPGHDKQGGRSLYQEDSHRRYSTPRSGDRFLSNDRFKASGPQGNGRFYRDNHNGVRQKEWRGRSRENNQQYNGPTKPLNKNKERSAGNSPARLSRPISEHSAQLDSKYRADKTNGANGSAVSPGIGKENSLECLNWKPLKWSRSGSLALRGSGVNHLSSSKSSGVESIDVKDELAPKNVTFSKSPSGDAAGVCGPSAEEIASRKKARLGWGQGLAKFESKTVEGPEENVASDGNVESTHSFTSNFADKSPNIASFSDCSSPAIPSVCCLSSGTGPENTYRKTTDDDSNNCCVSSMSLSQNQTEETQARLELNSITNLSSLLKELLQVDEHFSLDSGIMRSSAFNKLVLWKRDISKALELTETEIDLLENELKLLKGDSRQGFHYSSLSKISHTSDKNANSDGFNRPLPLTVVLSKGIGNTLLSHSAKEAQTENKDGDIDSPGTATSQFVEPRLTQKPVSDYGLGKSSKNARGNFFTCDVAKDIDDNMEVRNVCDHILACNKKTTSRASSMFTKLLPREKIDNRIDGVEAFRLSSLPVDTKIKERFLRRRRSLKFKERVISLKYRAFYHSWKEGLGLLSLRSPKMKPSKKFDVTSRAVQNGNRKHHQTIPARSASRAGSSTLVPSTEILNVTRKLLSDSQVKSHSYSLKMPAMILDDREKLSSRFVSRNGLVEDPCAVEKERALTNPWTIEEKGIFMEKLSTLGKDFRKIASFLNHKTIADCIQFYYKNQKSQSFEKTKKINRIKQVKDTYMLTPERKWGREMNSASLDILGAASIVAAQADQDIKTSKALSGNLNNKKPRVVSDGVIEESTSVDVTQPEQETHNTNDDGGGDDDTCSDEFCGEVDPVDWTDDEKSLFVQALSTHGKDFLVISHIMKTKTREQCKVFYSKAQKCLSLETSNPGSFNGGNLGSSDTNASVSDVEDDCVVETGSVCCSGKSSSRSDEDLNHVSQDVSGPHSTVADLSSSEGNQQLVCQDTDMEPEVLCPGNIMDLESVSEATNEKSAAAATATYDNQCKESTHLGSSSENQCLPVELSVEVDMNHDITHNNKPESHLGSSSENQCLPGESSVEVEMNHDITHNKPKSHLGSSSENQCSPVALSVEVEMNHDITHNNKPESHNVIAEIPLLPKREPSSDTEKPCHSGGVKLFGKILSKPSSGDTSTLIPQQNKAIATPHLTSAVVGLENVPATRLENVPGRNYGIWDGSKIQLVNYPPSSDLLLAKYPDAFANLTNTYEFPPREYNYGSGNFIDHPVFRNRNGFPSSFMLDFKQCQNEVPEVQRNTFEAVSNLSVLQGRDFTSGECTGVLDHVADRQMQYSHQQLGGSGSHTLNGVVRKSVGEI